MKRELTCIVCPLGCTLNVELDGAKVLDVTGNTCPRGKEYAENECTDPRRTVTSTVRCTDGSMVSVKTDAPISKAEMFRCMQIINQTVASLPIHIGDVLVEDACGSKIIATQNKF